MNRRTALLAFGAALLLLVMWFFFLWGPQGGKLRDAEERRELAEGQNSALEVRLARLEDVQDRAPTLLAELDELRAAVPDEPDLAQFILDANEIASGAGVEFLSIAPSVPAASEAGGPPVITLSISVTGGYFEVLDYLTRLESIPRVVVVDSLNLTPGGSDEGPLEIAVSLTARMFTQTVPGAVTEVPISSDGGTTTVPGEATTTTETTGG